MKKRLVIVFIGIILVVSVVLTGNYGLSDSDKQCYELYLIQISEPTRPLYMSYDVF